MSEVSRCSVCEAPIDGSGEIACVECNGLLRWFRSYFADLSRLDLERIAFNTRFIEDLGVDSLDYVDWVIEAKAVFCVDIADRDAERMLAVRDFVSLLRRGGARWLPNQDIAIEKKSWCRREWKAVTRDGP